MTKRPIIIDTDPGIDDAVAIAIALHSDKLDVRKITTVHGNVGLDKVTRNALTLLKFFGKNISVSAGAARPLLRDPINASEVHGESGMDGYDFEEPTDELLTGDHAINVMYKEIMESEEKITLVPIGPLTNIALLLKVYPVVVSRIKEIVLMGGTAGRGNASPLGEFNILADPEAAKIVFESEIPIAMLGLDIGTDARVYLEDSLHIKKLNRTGDMIFHLFERYRGGSMSTGLTMYDSTAIGYLLNPEMYQMVDSFVGIEVTGELTTGSTIVDLNNHLKKKPNAKVAIGLNEEEFRKWFIDCISKCP